MRWLAHGCRIRTCVLTVNFPSLPHAVLQNSASRKLGAGFCALCNPHRCPRCEPFHRPQRVHKRLGDVSISPISKEYAALPNQTILKERVTSLLPRASLGIEKRPMEENPSTQQFESHRKHLRAVAYRMLGSLTEAEDAVQECWLRLNRSDSDVISDYKGWLTIVVSRICLDMLRARRSSREEPIGDHLLRAIPSRKAIQEQEVLLADSVGIALLVLLDRLSPPERIAYVLHDLLGFPFAPIAGLLGRSSAGVRQLASRARRQIQGVGNKRANNLAQQRSVVSRFLSSLRTGDVEGLIAVLDPELVVTIDRSALPEGASQVVRGARTWASQAIAFSRHVNHIRAALVDGDVGILLAPQGHLMRVLRVTISDERITEIEIVADADKLARLRLGVLEDLNY